MKVIGIGGYARSGKDTFVSIAKQVLAKNNYNPVRVAFADTLKNEVQTMLGLNSFALDVYTIDSDAKTKIRPLLVWWGCARRDLSLEGLYWVNVVDRQLREMQAKEGSENTVVLVSDVRFPNEAAWIHDNWNGEIIHLKRFKTHYSESPVDNGLGNTAPIRTFDAAPNEEEAKNDPLVQKVADVLVDWESRDIPKGSVVTDDVYLQEQVIKALNATNAFTNVKLSL